MKKQQSLSTGLIGILVFVFIAVFMVLYWIGAGPVWAWIVDKIVWLFVAAGLILFSIGLYNVWKSR